MEADREIIQKVRAGDRDAFSKLYLDFHKRLVAFAYTYTHTIAIAEELVQDVFLELWDRRENWAVRESIAVYLFGAVRNRAVSAIRRENTAHRFWERLRQGIDITVPENEIYESAPTLVNALSSLTERARTMLALRYQQDLTYAAIASVLGSTEEAVRKQITRAMAQLSERLKPQN